MRNKVVMVAALALAGCVSKPADVLRKPPTMAEHSTKSVTAYVACVIPKLNAGWPFVRAQPTETGQQVLVDASMSIPKTMAVVDVQPAPDGALVSLHRVGGPGMEPTDAAVRSCL